MFLACFFHQIYQNTASTIALLITSDLNAIINIFDFFFYIYLLENFWEKEKVFCFFKNIKNCLSKNEVVDEEFSGSELSEMSKSMGMSIKKNKSSNTNVI